MRSMLPVPSSLTASPSGEVAAAVQPVTEEIGKNLGVVALDSRLLLEANEANRQRVHWRPLDWLLGTKDGQFTGLVFVAVALNIIGACAWRATGGNDLYDSTWNHSFWFAWGMFFDPGTEMGFDPGAETKHKFTAVFFSVLGFTYNLLMLGLIVDMSKTALDFWRRKYSRIVANGHTILLGWTEKTLFVMEELIKGAENRGLHLKIVVLAEMDEFTMEQEIARHFPHPHDQRRIRVRSGCPYMGSDLSRVSAVSAREIIILSPTGPPRHADLATIRTVVAMAALRRPPEGSVIAEVRSVETCSAVSAVLEKAEGIFARDAINRVLCLMAVQPILGDIFTGLMSWCEGAEIYCKSLQDLELEAYATFGVAARAVPSGICLGVQRQGRHAIMTPPDDLALDATDSLLVLAESEVDIVQKRYNFMPHTISKLVSRSSVRGGGGLAAAAAGGGGGSRFASTASFDDSPPAEVKLYADVSERRTLIMVGWPNDIDDMLVAMDDYVAPGTQVYILAETTEKERDRILEATHVTRRLTKLTLVHRVGMVTNLHALADLPLKDACAVLVLADDSLDEDASASDSACLACMVTLDGLLKGRYPQIFQPPESQGWKPPRVICEVLSPVIERAVAEGHKLRSCATFFHSSALETGLFTMASAQTQVYNTLLMLLQANDFGQLAVLPAQAYLQEQEMGPGGGAAFSELQERARLKDEVILGFCGRGSSIPQLNPKDREVVIDVQCRVLVLSRRLAPTNRDELR